MLFPRAVAALPAELPVGSFDDPVAVAGSSVTGAPCGNGRKTEIPPSIALPLDFGSDGVAAAVGPAVAGASEDDPGAGGAATGAADVRPTLLT